MRLPQPDPGESTARFAARLVVGAIAAGALVPAVLGAAHSANAGRYLAADLGKDRPERVVVQRMEHLGAEMARRIPPGTPVWVDDGDSLWRFRLIELATMHGLVVTDQEAQAAVVLRRRDDPQSPLGVRLEIVAAP